MKILCSISSIEFNVDHFPGTFYSREVHHPIFNLPQKKLLSYTHKWATGELTPTDSYLLFLAILHSSEKVDFRIPVFRNEQTNSIVANTMEYLVRTIIKLNAVSNPAVVFPQFVISQETRFLQNVRYWIETWEKAYEDFLSGYKSAHESSKIIRREAALQRMIKNPHKAIGEYAGQLAEWAELAGSFPQGLIPSPHTKLQIPLAEYWKSIIQKAAKFEYLYSIPAIDLADLLEHCETNIPAGSIYSNALFKLLRAAQEKQKNFLGLGDFDIKSTYTLLEPNYSSEDAEIRARIDAAPDEKPRPEQYPTKFQYLKAKLNWDMAEKYGRNTGMRKDDIPSSSEEDKSGEKE